MMSSKDGVGQVIKACVTVATLIALPCWFRVIKAALDDLLGLTRWTRDAIWPTQLTDRLITLPLIDQILHVDLQRWTPVRGWNMGGHQYTTSSYSTTLESNKSVCAMKRDTLSHGPRAWCSSSRGGKGLYEEACAVVPQAGLCEGEALGRAGSNTVKLPKPKGGSKRGTQSRPKHYTRPLYSTWRSTLKRWWTYASTGMDAPLLSSGDRVSTGEEMLIYGAWCGAAPHRDTLRHVDHTPR